MMSMTPRLRKFSLTLHLAGSIGWLGAVAAYLALAITALTSPNVMLTRGAYTSMELIGWFVIVPLSFAALLSGLVQSLGTEWGLFRHYWIAVKFFLTAIATVVLLGHMPKVTQMARIAAETAGPLAEFRPLRTQLVVHAGGGLIVLLVILALSIFKPWGMTLYGRRQGLGQIQGVPDVPNVTNRASLIFYALLVTTGVVIFSILFHLAGGGLWHH